MLIIVALMFARIIDITVSFPSHDSYIEPATIIGDGGVGISVFAVAAMSAAAWLFAAWCVLIVDSCLALRITDDSCITDGPQEGHDRTISCCTPWTARRDDSCRAQGP